MNIAVKNLQSKIIIPHLRISESADQVCRSLGLTKVKSEISIVFVGSQRMQSINRTYLKHDYVTDVITFDLGESCEIIICPIVAYKNAIFYKKKVSDEILLYVIHGLLHLAGFNDHSDAEIKLMRIKEEQMLAKIK